MGGTMSILETLSQQLSPEVIRGIGRQIGADEQKTGQAISALLPMLSSGMVNNASQPQGMTKLSQALERDHDGSILDHFSGMLGGASAQNNPYASVARNSGGGDILTGLLGSMAGGNSGGLANVLGGLMGAGGAGSILGTLMGGGNSAGNSGSAAGNILGTLLGGSGGGAADLLAGILGTAPTSSRATNVGGILGNILGGNVGNVQQGVSKSSGLSSGQIGVLMSILAPLIMGALGKAKRQQGLDSRGVADILKREQHTIQQRVPQAAEMPKILDSNRDGKVDMKDDIAKVGMALGSAMILGQMRKK
jgi:type II secretory pathway pseudopilin PulG